MGRFNCFSVLIPKNKTKKGSGAVGPVTKEERGVLQVKLEGLSNNQTNISDNDNNSRIASNSTSFNLSLPFKNQDNSTTTCKVQIMGQEASFESDLSDQKQSPKSKPGPEATILDAAYEGEDEHEFHHSAYREASDYDPNVQLFHKPEEKQLELSISSKAGSYGDLTVCGDYKSEREDLTKGGHVSDPGVNRAYALSPSSPKLKRSCSNLETRDSLKRHNLQPFEEVLSLCELEKGSPTPGLSPCSADRVMLKRRSSSQVLPSRSRRLWWKLFLWSHRNMHKSHQSNRVNHEPMASSAVDEREGYTSDNLELHRIEPKSPESSTCGFQFQTGVDSGPHKNDTFWNCNQWVAFPSETSPLSRVDEWVSSIDVCAIILDDEHNDDGNDGYNDTDDGGGDGVSSPCENGAELVDKLHKNIHSEVLQANNVIRSLNSFSTVAHISGMGLKVIPAISMYSSLRVLNLSGNFIVHISPGSLPKGLHTLNLSRNKIVTIEGLRELTRLRVLDLSYNRISRIGQGLSNCTLIKELYLAGNKISDVEGLHRLLKLTVLDLSFNKITTAKALGQLVANYNSLQALNLLGNPIQANMGEESLRRAVSNLLPQLTFLNKQAIKPLRTREVAMDTVAKAALGSNSGGWHSRRKPIRRISSQQGLVTSARSSRRRGGSSSRKHEKGGNVGHEALSSHRRLRVSS
ncbi:uncharacterized protein LOC18442931 [Amborella trichopoda]|nr:uncharacterized protein LOC18442931 [Amborella trichopoda]XP_011626537.1 uncharacterized protein LOC18442931 [Amborella trichopoda]XP_020528328.1 uncharacterized protein LOC18442931 [Amborella trichopoda]|eukprot:XP_006853199.2 uncharacterized protein LOC18442931 [Amborella trichopoda]